MAHDVCRLSKLPIKTDSAADHFFAPSPEDYPHLPISYSKDLALQTHQKSIRGSQTNWWRELEIVCTEIGHWPFVCDYDDLPRVIWDHWMDHETQGTTVQFEKYLQDAIEEGQNHIQRLTDILVGQMDKEPKTMDFREWSIDIALLFSQVHRAIAFISL
jgi:hypothetical protein